MQGSTASTISTGVSCFRFGAGVGLSFAAVMNHLVRTEHNKKKAGLRGRPFSDEPIPSGDGGVPTLIRVKTRTEYAAHHAKHSEIHPRLNRNVAVRGVRGLENNRAVLARVGLYRRLFTKARGYDVVVMWILAGIHHHVVAIVH